MAATPQPLLHPCSEPRTGVMASHVTQSQTGDSCCGRPGPDDDDVVKSPLRRATPPLPVSLVMSCGPRLKLDTNTWKSS
ncbi:hypothetical protein J6590_053821 [Homalodisca vitripennis]|nr:hypothetical protein J6590_053821 [Homalodisca vitripennis]